MTSVRKLRGIGMLVGSLAGAAGVVKQLQNARRDGDKLALANAVATALTVITGLALAVRSLRGKGGSR